MRTIEVSVSFSITPQKPGNGIAQGLALAVAGSLVPTL